MKKLIALMLAAMLLMLCGCSSEDSSEESPGSGSSADKESLSADAADFADAESFEAALNRGEDTIGKTVTFKVRSVSPDSYFGYDLWAGEHLNFIFSQDQNAEPDDVFTVEVKSAYQVATGSWIINDPNYSGDTDKNIAFTVKKKVGCINFSVPESLAAETEIEGGTTYVNVDVTVSVARLGINIDLADYTEDYEPLNISGAAALHYQDKVDNMYVDIVLIDTENGVYSIACGSGVSAEMNAMYYEDLIKTVSVDSQAVKPDPSDDAPEKSFELFKLSGTGSKVIKNISLPPVVCVLYAKHSGSRNFIAHYYSASGRSSYLFNEIGKVNSVQVYDATRNGTTDGGMLEVNADGDWEITFIPLADYLEDASLHYQYSGTGDSVEGFFVAEGMTVVKAYHGGSRNFIVRVYECSEDGDSLYAFNEIGQYSGETVLRTKAGKKYFFNVEADGYWELKIDS